MSDDRPSFTEALDPFTNIEAAERRGQRRMTTAEVLPSSGLVGEPAWERMGIKIDGVHSGLFMRVTLPDGWTKQPTDHQMWSHLLDGKGRIRGLIFYKAASYDERAFIRPVCRFTVERDYERDGVLVVRVLDQGKPIHTREAVDPRGRESFTVEDALAVECRNWLTAQGYPNHADPAAYWEAP